MEAGIADTINRQTANLLAKRLDDVDQSLGFDRDSPWYVRPMGNTFMEENDATNADRAWLVGALVQRGGSGIDYGSFPADGDWENLFSHIRAEVQTRRDRRTSSVRAAEIPVRDGVGSQ